MSTNTKLTIKARSYADEKKTVSNTINYVNPNLDNSTALQLAQRVNALTLNTYKSTDKIETTELDSIIPKAERVINTPRIWSGSTQVTSSLVDGYYTASFTLSKVEASNYTFDIWIDSSAFADIDCLPSVTSDNATEISFRWLKSSNRWNTTVSLNNTGVQTATLEITFTANQTYQATTVPIKIIVTEG